VPEKLDSINKIPKELLPEKLYFHYSAIYEDIQVRCSRSESGRQLMEAMSRRSLSINRRNKDGRGAGWNTSTL